MADAPRVAEAWEAFGREVLRDAHEVEGLQEIGVKHGVLVPTPVTAPCVAANGDGEHRGCVCYETDNIPGTCYRTIPRTPPAAPQEGTEREPLASLVATVMRIPTTDAFGTRPADQYRADVLAALHRAVDDAPRGA